MHFTFVSPYFLLLFLFVPCLWICPNAKGIFFFPKHQRLGKRIRFFDLRKVWLLLIASSMIISLAQPISYTAHTQNKNRGRDLFLALDASGSMAQRGFDPQDTDRSKFDLLLDQSREFMQKRGDDNIGIVLFGSFAYIASPLTYDINALKKMLQLFQVGIAGESTAIGDAIVRSIEGLKRGKAKSKMIILITDGKHNSGTHSPKDGVEMAKKEGIKIYSIGIGNKRDFDEQLLKRISEQTGAKSFVAKDLQGLKELFEIIDTAEPSPVRSESYVGKKPIYLLFLFSSMVMYLYHIYRSKR